MKENALKKLVARSCYGHLGGDIGNRLFERLIELCWFEREEGKSTVYKLTEIGYIEFDKLGVNLDSKENKKDE